MFPVQSFRFALATVREPLTAMREVARRPLEDTIGKYLVLLAYSGIVAGLVSLLWALGRGVYLDVVHNITIDYWRLINYFGQVLMGTFFLYIFFGTFILFLITLIVHRFAAHAKYVHVVAVTCASTAPLLLFGWVNYRVLIALLIWMLFLLVTGIFVLRETAPVALRDVKRAASARSKKK